MKICYYSHCQMADKNDIGIRALAGIWSTSAGQKCPVDHTATLLFAQVASNVPLKFSIPCFSDDCTTIDNFKIIDVQQAKVINNFKNAKQKLLKTNAAVWFSKIYRINQLIPKCIQIKIKGYCAICWFRRRIHCLYGILRRPCLLF
jgi:hypothetical protein